MAIPTQPLPTIGQPNTSEDPKVRSALSELQTVLTGGTDVTNLSTGTLQLLGLTNGSQIGRGKSIIATSESRGIFAFGALATPDRVTSIVLPTDALLFVAYHATWQSSVASAGSAAIFVGANQLKRANPTIAAPAAQGITTAGLGAATKGVLFTDPGGLRSYSAPAFSTPGVASYSGDVTTGQVLGTQIIKYQDTDSADGAGGAPNRQTTDYHSSFSPAIIFAAAGTYDISIQFLASSGTVTVENRKLWVWSVGF